MAIEIATISGLKSLDTSQSKNPRFVIEKKAWYHLDITDSTTSGDDENVVVPNSGTGRWFKQKAISSNETPLTTEIKNANFTAQLNHKYYIDASSGVLTCTLPATASLGSKIYLTKIDSNYSIGNRIIIDRNNSKINGDTKNLAIWKPFSTVELEYSNTDVGWVIISGDYGKEYVYEFNSIITFPRPADTTLPQDGIFKYVGENLGTGSWVNPATRSTGSAVTVKWFLGGVNSYTYYNYEHFKFTDRTQNAANLGVPNTNDVMYFTFSFFKNTSANPPEPLWIIPSSVYFEFSSTWDSPADNNLLWTTFFGLDDVNINFIQLKNYNKSLYESAGYIYPKINDAFSNWLNNYTKYFQYIEGNIYYRRPNPSWDNIGYYSNTAGRGMILDITPPKNPIHTFIIVLTGNIGGSSSDIFNRIIQIELYGQVLI